ncbi:MAG: glycine cleavage system aminomethyltransferase GcvT, partial [Thermodesulfobacteriota bacterium]
MGLKRTALYGRHRALGARLVDFAGWEMPVQYTGVIAEHLMVRSSCGLFDVSHMGEVEITGPGAVGAVQRLFTNDIEKVSGGGCQYTLLCNPEGGVVDDCIVYRFTDERVMVVVNGANTEKAFRWIRSNLPDRAEARDASGDYALLALQGPAAEDFLQPLVNIDLAELQGFRFAVTGVLGHEAVVSRTGYTGEDGFEIYIGPEHAPGVWDHLLALDGILPAGLGARDTLRLEMGY